MSLGLAYSPDESTKVQSNINLDYEIETSLIQTLSKGVEVTLSVGVEGKKAAFSKAGAGLAFAF